MRQRRPARYSKPIQAGPTKYADSSLPCWRLSCYWLRSTLCDVRSDNPIARGNSPIELHSDFGVGEIRAELIRKAAGQVALIIANEVKNCPNTVRHGDPSAQRILTKQPPYEGVNKSEFSKRGELRIRKKSGAKLACATSGDCMKNKHNKNRFIDNLG